MSHSSNNIHSSPAFFSLYKTQIDQHLNVLLSRHSDQGTSLFKAMRYSTLLGGKRIRPILTLATASIFNISSEKAIRPACAVELIHAYSLIHDDLPSMDDDDLRRGQATCHIAYNEATAILAGDALQALAFTLLSDNDELSAQHRIDMIKILSRACGSEGMVLGQAIDFDSVGQILTIDQLEQMHRLKTGALLQASVLLGAYCSHDEIETKERKALENYANAIGLAFQVQDDILDVESDTETLGKMQGADIALNKPTYPALLGLDGAKNKLLALHEEALLFLEEIPNRNTSQLAEISHFIVARER